VKVISPWRFPFWYMTLRHRVIRSGRFGREVLPLSPRVNKYRKSSTAACVTLIAASFSSVVLGEGFECSVAVDCAYTLSLPDRVQVIAVLN